MILQIDKTKDVPEGEITVLKSDFIEGIKRTLSTERGVQLYLADDVVLTLERDMGGRFALYNYLDDYNGYTIGQAWLLNDQGKTLKRLF
ncbi:hypothetical protein H1_138 [Efunavirus H1]|uniref:Uncharacterized protein n=1 Tax=Enterococcus phage H1 TaxID=2982918 RepID=A0AAE9T7B1_9CAUD|nr:hypothetical protein H1_138 [Enterococcus phage H1]